MQAGVEGGGGGVDFWWGEGEILLGGGMISKFLAGGERTSPAPSPSRENSDLHSSLRCF